MRRDESLQSIAKFIAEYAAHMMGCGVHTSRVVRSAKRIGDAYETDVNISVFQRNIILTLKENNSDKIHSEVVDIPALPISFEHNAELSALSWNIYDNNLSLADAWKLYNKIVNVPSIDSLFVLILVGFANASFCKLFGGDWFSMTIVFSATITGMFLKQQMQRKHFNHYIIFIVCAFIASLCASTAYLFDTTSEIALATSVLYLVPGVPLINGVIDIVEGYTLTGFARLVNALMLVLCIAIGLSLTLVLVKDNLIIN